MDILQNETGRCAQRIVDQRGVLGDIRHFLTRGVEFQTGILIMRKQTRLCLRVTDNLLAKCGGDTFCCDVVMSGPDTATGEHQIVRGRHGLHRLDNGLADVGDNPRLAKLDTLAVQLLGKPADILVLGATAQNLVSDHNDRGCGIGHGNSLCCQITVRVPSEITSIWRWSRLKRCENM